MLLHDCKTEMSPTGELQYAAPGFGSVAGSITPWSSGFRTFRVRDGRRVECPAWTLRLVPGDDENHAAEADQFLAEIPEHLRSRIGAFAFGQCPMLRWLAIYPEARDLVASHPKLFWLLAAAVHDGHVRESQLAVLLKTRQVRILFAVSGASSAAAVRFLHKVIPARGTLSEARKVARALRTSWVRKTFAHHKTAPLALVTAVMIDRQLSHPAVVQALSTALASQPHRAQRLFIETADTVRDIRRMGELLDIPNIDEAIARCHDLGALSSLHDRWTERVNRRQDLVVRVATQLLPDVGAGGLADDQPQRLSKAALSQIVFPAAPVEDSGNICAIRTASELLTEGDLQQHCVASYAKAIAAREVAIYKVLGSHRATLELRNTEDGWKLGQIRQARNTPADPRVVRAVSAWFEAALETSQPPPVQTRLSDLTPGNAG